MQNYVDADARRVERIIREQASDIERLTAENERLRAAVKECADDLEAANKR